MTPEIIHKLIREGEGTNLEFKESKERVNKDIYTTICAFLNRIGGIILLGVKDNGKIVGINPQNIVKIKKDIITSVNNPQKIFPPVSLLVEDLKVEGKTIIAITVPESSQVHRCNGRIYDRNEDGDFDITNRPDDIAMLYIRKQAEFSENKVYPYLTMAELRHDIIRKVKKLIRINNPLSPLPEMDDEEMLHSLGLYQRDYTTGKEGYTLAAMLIFGRDDVIFSTVPYYKTDALVRIRNVDRYDDREIVNTNLIDAFEQLQAFAKKHLPDPFYLEEENRLSLRDVIFREVIANTLIHREYLSHFPAKFVIEADHAYTENGNKPHGYGFITPQNFAVYPKNPKIARIFREIGRADELGSGVRKIFKYTPLYSSRKQAVFEEKDIFRIIIPLPADVQLKHEQTETLKPRKKKTSEKILDIIRQNPKITIRELQEKLNLSKAGIEWNLNKLKEQGKIKRVGSDREGFWQIIEEN